MKRKILTGKGSIELGRDIRAISANYALAKHPTSTKDLLDSALLRKIFGINHRIGRENIGDRFSVHYILTNHHTRVKNFLLVVEELKTLHECHGAGKYTVFSRKQSPYEDKDIGILFTPPNWAHADGGKGLPKNCWVTSSITMGDSALPHISKSVMALLKKITRLAEPLLPTLTLHYLTLRVGNAAKSVERVSQYDHEEHVREYEEYTAWVNNRPAWVQEPLTSRFTNLPNELQYYSNPAQAQSRVQSLRGNLESLLKQKAEKEEQLSYVNVEALEVSLSAALNEVMDIMFYDEEELVE